MGDDDGEGSLDDGNKMDAMVDGALESRMQVWQSDYSKKKQRPKEMTGGCGVRES